MSLLLLDSGAGDVDATTGKGAEDPVVGRDDQGDASYAEHPLILGLLLALSSFDPPLGPRSRFSDST